MKEAQRFPADFDGIIAGAPGLDWTGRAAQAVRVLQGARDGTRRRACRRRRRSCCTGPRSTRATRSTASKDGLIADPARCTFDPAVLRVQGRERRRRA